MLCHRFTKIVLLCLFWLLSPLGFTADAKPSTTSSDRLIRQQDDLSALWSFYRQTYIRDGRVIYPEPGSSREASVESLRRFKEDVREVREGLECGIKIAGYDDIKVGDVIEAYRIEEVKRTL